jgi:hypothetical protein
MIQNPSSTVAGEIPAIPIRSCPFCANSAELVGATGHFGVCCLACGVGFLAIYPTREVAVDLWNRRIAGTAGGRATAGRCSRRKLRAAKRNLRRARQQKKLRAIRAHIEALLPKLQAARDAEMAELKAAAARSRAKLESLMARSGAALPCQVPTAVTPSAKSFTADLDGRANAEEIGSIEGYEQP